MIVLVGALLLISAGRGNAIDVPEPISTPIVKEIAVTIDVIEPIAVPLIDYNFRDTAPKLPIIYYRVVPIENLNPIEWVNPPALLDWQMDRILRWGPMINLMIETYDYPEEYYMLALGIIAQETQGDEKVFGCDFNGLGVMCGVGVMAIVPRSWTNTAEALRNPRINISIGMWLFDIAMKNAVEKYNYRPGRDATRAALGAYNCGFQSLIADRCYSFGGFMYASKVMNYWIPLLETRIEELK